jgi:hypothetical protein
LLVVRFGLKRIAVAMSKVRGVRMGEQQEIETVINEEALLFAQYLRNERQSWNPRIT